MGSDVLESRGRRFIEGNNVRLAIIPDSKEEADRLFTLLSAGGTVEMPMADAPWGDYYGSLVDKYGTGWMIDYRYKPEEKKKQPVGSPMAGKK
jgi:PhnB protein